MSITGLGALLRANGSRAGYGQGVGVLVVGLATGAQTSWKEMGLLLRSRDDTEMRFDLA